MKRLLILILIVYSKLSLAQNKVDSLIGLIPSTSNDTLKARLYNRIFNELAGEDLEKALAYARIGLAHAEKMKWRRGIAVFRDDIGRVYSDKSNYDSAIYYYNKSLAIHIEDKDSVNIATSYNNIGNANQNIRSDYAVAASYYFKALEIAEAIKNDDIKTIYLDNISRLYMIQQNSAKAIEFAIRALERAKINDNIKGIALALETIGNIYFQEKDLLKAKAYYDSSYTFFLKLGDRMGIAIALTKKALTMANDYREILAARLEARKIFDEINPLHINAITNMGNIGYSYFDLARYDSGRSKNSANLPLYNKAELLAKSEEYFKQAISLCEQTGEFDTRSFFMGNLAELQAYKGDYKNAYFNFKSYSDIQDSIYSQENKNRIAAAESQRELDKKNSELQIKQLALLNQRKTTWGLIAGLALLTTIGLLITNQYRRQKRNNELLMRLNNELDVANKQKAKFFGILSHDLRSPIARLISFIELQKNDPTLLSNEQIKEHEKKISHSAESLLETMEAMLLWSKGQMEQFKPVITSFAVADSFDYLKRFFSTVEGVDISYLDPEAAFVTTDQNYLQTIMQNLTANSISAVKKVNNGSITWEAKVQNNSVHLSISDNGPGLTQTQIDAFTNQTSISSTRSGLGFHIIRDLAKTINCEIQLKRSDNGAHFVLVLPH